MEEFDSFKQLEIKNVISVHSQYTKTVKKEVLKKLNESLYTWNGLVKGVMINYTNLKLRKKLVEIIEEQDYLNIPVKYEAVYFIPSEGQHLVGEVVEVTEKCMKLEIFGFIYGYVDLESISGSININYSEILGNSINVLTKAKHQQIKIGDVIGVQMIRHYVRPNKTVVLACVVDLNNLNIISRI